MSKEKILSDLKKYEPFNEQEERDRELIKEWIENYPDAFLRTNLTAHITSSAWVTDSTGTKVLMAYHNLYDSWAWLGGHADGETDLLSVALREVSEEAGIKSAKPLSDDIFSLEILTVDGHEKKGKYVPSHLHLNVTYLLEADPDEKVSVKEDENSAVGWFSLDEAIEKSTEPWFKERIYSKLNEKLRIFKGIK